MASRTSSVAAPLLRHIATSQPLLRAAPSLSKPALTSFSPIAGLQRSRYPSAIAVRAAHSIPRPPGIRPKQPSDASPSASSPSPPGAAAADDDAPTSEGERPEVASGAAALYQLSFTCNPCGHRSHHNVSKQAYHTGSTLITCPSCRNRHVISDHLNIFGDRKITIEDLMREKGQIVKRGSLGEDGDIEFWPAESYAEQDGTKDQTS